MSKFWLEPIIRTNIIFDFDKDINRQEKDMVIGEKLMSRILVSGCVWTSAANINSVSLSDILKMSDILLVYSLCEKWIWISGYKGFRR